MDKCKKGRPKVFKDKVNINVAVEREFYNHLERQAVEMGRREGRLIQVSETVRRGLEAAFPTKKQQMLDI